MNITIPATIEEAQQSLGSLGALLTAKEWERAAIVYAFTEPGSGQGTPRGRTAAKLSYAGFARLKVNGLTREKDIAAYRKRWESAIQDGAPEATPGATFEMPSLPWTSLYDDTDRGQAAVEERAFKRILKDPERFEKVVTADPDVADLAAERVVETTATRWRAEENLTERRSDHATTNKRPVEARKTVERVIKAIDSFFDTPIKHNGVEMTYRDVIQTVAETPEARELHRLSIGDPQPLAVDLRTVLDRLAVDATNLSGLFLLEAGEEVTA